MLKQIFMLQQVKMLAIKANLTLSQIADRIGYSRTHMYDAIRNPEKYPGVIKKILDTCNTK